MVSQRKIVSAWVVFPGWNWDMLLVSSLLCCGFLDSTTRLSRLTQCSLHICMMKNQQVIIISLGSGTKPDLVHSVLFPILCDLCCP